MRRIGSEVASTAGRANQWREYAAALDDLDEQITELQDAKKGIYTQVRDVHGKVLATALKNALKLRRMDAEARERADAIEAETLAILNAIGFGTVVAITRAAHDEPHDPETGEIEDQAGTAPDAPVATAHAEPAADEGSATASRQSGAALDAATVGTAPAGRAADKSPATIHAAPPIDLTIPAFLVRGSPDCIVSEPSK